MSTAPYGYTDFAYLKLFFDRNIEVSFELDIIIGAILYQYKQTLNISNMF
jgi:hypothetical protein